MSTINDEEIHDLLTRESFYWFLLKYLELFETYTNRAKPMQQAHTCCTIVYLAGAEHLKMHFFKWALKWFQYDRVPSRKPCHLQFVLYPEELKGEVLEIINAAKEYVTVIPLRSRMTEERKQMHMYTINMWDLPEEYLETK